MTTSGKCGVFQSKCCSLRLSVGVLCDVVVHRCEILMSGSGHKDWVGGVQISPKCVYVAMLSPQCCTNHVMIFF